MHTKLVIAISAFILGIIATLAIVFGLPALSNISTSIGGGGPVAPGSEGLSYEEMTYDQAYYCEKKSDCVEINNPRNVTCGQDKVVVPRVYVQEYRDYIDQVNFKETGPGACLAVLTPDPIGYDCIENTCKHIYPEE